ncbi:MAG: hypothetical protein V7L26_30565 [Nostoc sp.]|uniref:hypothetical protein n=1 Tax=Nostoc sp. TaxID=1180 RepID=UPI002FF8CF49
MTNTDPNPTAKYYVCEGSANAGITKVTPTDDPGKALSIAQASAEKVHFVSTVNPLSNEVDDET